MTTHGAQETYETFQKKCDRCDRVTTHYRYHPTGEGTCQECAPVPREAQERGEVAPLTDEQIEAAIEHGNADREGREVDTEETTEAALQRIARELEVTKRERDSWKLRAQAAITCLRMADQESIAKLYEALERDSAVVLAACKLAADLRDEVRRG